MFTASNLSPIKHGFFGSAGGVSSGQFSSLNCGYGSGDSDANVDENRHLVKEQIGADNLPLITLKQVHGNRVVYLDSSPANIIEADGMVTDNPNFILGILTADCVPVLLADLENGVIGAVHAGWKSAFSGIIPNAINEMQNLGATKIRAAIGACISYDSYEVGQEFLETFLQQTPDNQTFFKPANAPEKYFFNMAGYVKTQLKQCGIKNIEIINEDTLSQPDKFFSYRRAYIEGDKICGRQISVISLNDKEKT